MPAAASSRAIAAPIPRPPPVTLGEVSGPHRRPRATYPDPGEDARAMLADQDQPAADATPSASAPTTSSTIAAGICGSVRPPMSTEATRCNLKARSAAGRRRVDVAASCADDTARLT